MNLPCLSNEPRLACVSELSIRSVRISLDMLSYYKLHIQSSSLVVVNKLRVTVRAQDNS